MGRRVPDAQRGTDPRRVTDGGAPAPAVPEAQLSDGWERVDSSVETLFELDRAGIRVQGHTLVYEDRPLREAVRATTDGQVNQTWRFFFATRLTFEPPLPTGVGLQMVLPAVRSEARRHFVDDLRARGFESIEQGRREKLRTRGGTTVRLQQVSGSFTPPTVEGPLPIEGWVGVWSDGGLYVAGGAYPATPLTESFAGDDAILDRDPGTYRDELYRVLRGVGD